MTAIGLVLLFLLTLATNNRALYERNYAWLFGVNVLVAALLLGCWCDWRPAAFAFAQGALAAVCWSNWRPSFALVGLMPGVLIYVVSYQFVTRSIESWFDVKVEGALVAGSTWLGVAGVTGRRHGRQDAHCQCPGGPGPIGHRGAGAGAIRDQLGATDVVLWNAAGQPIGSAGQSRFSLNPERPSAALLRSVREQRIVTRSRGWTILPTPTPCRWPA